MENLLRVDATKFLVYVQDFKAKSEMVLTLQPGRVYEAVNDGSFINIVLPEGGQFIISDAVTDNDNFYCNVVRITEQNRATLAGLTPEDRLLVDKHFQGQPVIIKSAEEFQGFIENLKKEHVDAEQRQYLETVSAIQKLAVLDGLTFSALHDVLLFIGKTFEDKYESHQDIGLEGLKFMGPHGAGFNVGNAAKYLKRYLTIGYAKSGNIEDLYKAIHYLLFEIARHKFMQRNPDEPK